MPKRRLLLSLTFVLKIFSQTLLVRLEHYRCFKREQVKISIDLSRIPLQCVRTITPERGWGEYFHTFAVFHTDGCYEDKDLRLKTTYYKNLHPTLPKTNAYLLTRVFQQTSFIDCPGSTVRTYFSYNIQ